MHQIFLYAWNGICICVCFYLHLLTRVFLSGGWGLIINNSPPQNCQLTSLGASPPTWTHGILFPIFFQTDSFKQVLLELRERVFWAFILKGVFSEERNKVIERDALHIIMYLKQESFCFALSTFLKMIEYLVNF